jgi:preprotein translocase subunit SecE
MFNSLLSKLAFSKFLNETVIELKKVDWPSREETIQMTVLVIGASTIVAFYLGGLDYIFTQLMKIFLR